MEHIFIVNPISGKADASLFLVPQLIEAAKRADVPYKILLTERPRHAVELAQQAAANGAVRCYACGGDGTLNEVFEGVWRAGNPQAEVASVPCGSGNDFIRNVSGQELEQFKTLKKFAKAAGFGVKTATKIGLGAAKIVGASCVITAQNACKFASFAFDEIAYQFEGTYASEGADLSAPTRRGCITGRIHYSGRSYGDFDW